MIKLLHAQFTNFRFLRDLSLDLSGEDEKKLTVIRAENDSGKTTIMTALQWALYGDSALPNEGKGYRLHPIDWDEESVAISVEVEFEATILRSSKSNQNEGVEEKRKYRIIRSARETIKNPKWDRSAPSVKLFRLDDTGSREIDPPEVLIEEMFPPELREVFFTDGDRALSFIEASSTTIKRDRVQKAIRSLLGLNVIEGARDRVENAEKKVNKSAKDISNNATLNETTETIERIEKESEELDKKIKDAKSQIANFDTKMEELKKKIDAALSKGNHTELKAELEQSKKRIERIDSQRKEAEKSHAQLFRNMGLARDLLKPVLVGGLEKLKELHDAGKIPNTTVPVLEDRLEKGVCICGESLSQSDADSKKRHENICKLIQESKDADTRQLTLADLYSASKSLQFVQTENAGWQEEYEEICKLREGLRTQREEEVKGREVLKVKLDKIPDVNIEVARDQERDFAKQRDRLHSQLARDEHHLEILQKEKMKLTKQQDDLLRKEKKGVHILAELTAARDILEVLNNSYNRITNDELNQVSQLMNEIFLEMIGADPDQGAIIRRAEINEKFDIVVYSDNDRTLNPDRDLNGASRRALTLSFILALAKVSEAKTSNVIDTPLGMMSGYVKKSVLKTAIGKSSQLILFLTRSEIKDCEEILDEEAARVITLTNPAHHPLMLINKPPTNERTILSCACDHRRECDLCERRTDAEA